MTTITSDRIAVAKQPRPRGFIDWTPAPHTRQLLDQVNEILDQYRDQLPLTARQLFYRLVGAYGYEKTERAYERLGEALKKARKAGLLNWSAIRDDGRMWDKPYGFAVGDQLHRTVEGLLRSAPFDPSTEQPIRTMVMAEAKGMVPMLARVAHTFGAPVMGTGGFTSTTSAYDLATTVAREPRPVVILQIGDHDPSGTHLFQSMAEEVEAFAADLGGEVAFKRVAVTAKQIADMGLPMAPPKTTDKRAFTGDTVQAEAIPPDVLQRLLRGALEEHFDTDIFEAGRDAFDAERARLATRWRDA